MQINFANLVDRFYNKSPRIRSIVSKVIFGDKDVYIKLLDTELEINTLRESGYYRAFTTSKNSSFLRDELSVLMNISMILDKDDTFVDVGANIGIFSSLISRFCHIYPNFNIYAFEANPETYKRLDKNAVKHGFHSFNTGISDRACKLDFVEGAVSHVFTTVENASAYNLLDKTIEITCQRLDEFDIIGESIVLKIDVEGQELEVLEGAKKLFNDRRIKAVYLDGFSQQAKVIDFLSKHGFSFFDGRNMIKSDGRIFSLLALRNHQI
jgi:FkbM family methyltransferase